MESSEIVKVLLSMVGKTDASSQNPATQTAAPHLFSQSEPPSSPPTILLSATPPQWIHSSQAQGIRIFDETSRMTGQTADGFLANYSLNGQKNIEERANSHNAFDGFQELTNTIHREQGNRPNSRQVVYVGYDEHKAPRRNPRKDSVRNSTASINTNGYFGKILLNRLPSESSLLLNPPSNHHTTEEPIYEEINPTEIRSGFPKRHISREHIHGTGFKRPKQNTILLDGQDAELQDRDVHMGPTFEEIPPPLHAPVQPSLPFSTTREATNKYHPINLPRGPILMPDFSTSAFINSRSFSQSINLVTYRTHSPLLRDSILPEHPSGPCIITNEHEPLTVVLETLESTLIPEHLTAFISVIDSHGNIVTNGIRHQNVPYDRIEMSRAKNYMKIRVGVHTTSCFHYGVDLSHLDREHGGFLFYSIKLIDKYDNTELAHFTLPPMWVVSKAPACRFQPNNVFHKIVSHRGVWTRSWRLVPGNKSYNGRNVNGKLQVRSTLHSYGPVNKISYEEYLATRTSLQSSTTSDSFMFEFALSPIPELDIHDIFAPNPPCTKEPKQTRAIKDSGLPASSNLCEQDQAEAEEV